MRSRFFGRAIFRVLFTLPWIFPDSIAATMWKFAAPSGWGIVNSALVTSGLTSAPDQLLSTDKRNLVGYRGAHLEGGARSSSWRYSPAFRRSRTRSRGGLCRRRDALAAPDLHQAAPAQTRALGFGTILAAWTLVIFDLVFVLTGGGPLGSTEILSMTIYNAGFSDGKIGLASACRSSRSRWSRSFSYFYVRRKCGPAWHDKQYSGCVGRAGRA